MKINVKILGQESLIIIDFEIPSISIGEKLILMSGGTSSKFLVYDIEHYAYDCAHHYTLAIVIKI